MVRALIRPPFEPVCAQSAQVRERWYNRLNPNLNRDAWTDFQDGALTTAVGELGIKSWSDIAKRQGLQGRTPKMCRARWLQLETARKRAVVGHPTVQHPLAIADPTPVRPIGTDELVDDLPIANAIPMTLSLGATQAGAALPTAASPDAGLRDFLGDGPRSSIALADASQRLRQQMGETAEADGWSIQVDGGANRRHFLYVAPTGHLFASAHAARTAASALRISGELPKHIERMAKRPRQTRVAREVRQECLTSIED